MPFMLIGNTLAFWLAEDGVKLAVIGFLSWIGLTRPAFPFAAAGQRAVMGVSFVLAAVAIAMAIVTSK